MDTTISAKSANETRSGLVTKFSWRRMVMLYRFNAPWIKRQTLIYLIFSLGVSLLFLFSHRQSWQLGVYTMLGLVLAFMYVFSPLVFLKGGDARMVERMLPASALEKFLFYVSYLFVVIPLACFMFPWIAEKIYPVVFDTQHPLAGMFDISGADIYQNNQILAFVTGMVTCLYCVLHARSGRYIKAIAFSVMVYIGSSVISAIYTTKEAFMAGYEAGAKYVDNDEITQRVTESISGHQTYATVWLIIMITYILLMMGLSYRSISRRNF